MFQKPNGLDDYHNMRDHKLSPTKDDDLEAYGGNRLDNENDHSESDEGINQEKPNFDGNEFMFRKRAPGDEQHNAVRSAKGTMFMDQSEGEDIEALHTDSRKRGNKSNKK